MKFLRAIKRRTKLFMKEIGIYENFQALSGVPSIPWGELEDSIAVASALACFDKALQNISVKISAEISRETRIPDLETYSCSRSHSITIRGSFFFVTTDGDYYRTHITEDEGSGVSIGNSIQEVTNHILDYMTRPPRRSKAVIYFDPLTGVMY